MVSDKNEEMAEVVGKVGEEVTSSTSTDEGRASRRWTKEEESEGARERRRSMAKSEIENESPSKQDKVIVGKKEYRRSEISFEEEKMRSGGIKYDSRGNPLSHTIPLTTWYDKWYENYLVEFLPRECANTI